MMPGAKPFRTKELSHQINSARLSFAPPEYLEKFLDVLPGSVSIMGLMNDKNHDINLLIDEDVLKPDFIGCHPCMNTSSLKIKTSDILEKFLPATNHTPTLVKL
jgi:Ala-tRNA(Pro) deacylase